jgi:hypothetical protein
MVMPLALASGFMLLIIASGAPASEAEQLKAILIQQDQPPEAPSTPNIKAEPAPETQTEPARKSDQAAPSSGQQAPGASTPAGQTPAAQSEPAPQVKPIKPADEHRRTSAAKKKTAPPSARKTTTSKKRSQKRYRSTAQQKQPPAKIVVPHGSTADPTIQLTPTVSQQQASTQLQNTNTLLDKTDANLKKISNRQLNTTQQETLSQIRTYMEQAKVAANAGDVQRANNLAVKAQLLSEELIKQ